MSKKVQPAFFAILIAAFLFTACSKDDNNNNTSGSDDPSADTPAEVSDPASLQEGHAEFTTAGTETFEFTNATCTWVNSGVLSFSGRKYAETEVTLDNAANDVYLSVIFFVHDPNADIDGGALPTEGSYDFDLSFTELTSTDTESYAEISLGGDGLENYYSDTGSEGTVTITSFDGNILEGEIHLNNMVGESNENAKINIAASFKASEG